MSKIDAFTEGYEQGRLQSQLSRMELKWEKIADKTWRLPVPSGWLIKTKAVGVHGISVSTACVPDPEHKWLSLEDRESELEAMNNLLHEENQELRDQIALAEAELQVKRDQ